LIDVNGQVQHDPLSILLGHQSRKMKTKPQILTLVTLVLLAIPGFTQSLNKLKAYNISIHGSSTLHEWESKVTKAEWTAPLTLDATKHLTLPGAELKIPVAGIQSEHGKIMDTKTYEAFNSEKNPYITFKMKAFTQKIVGNDILMAIEGDLTMNGFTNLIMLSVTGKTLANGDIQFTGSRSLKMTDYKMKPPTAMMGTIKVGDEVTVKFDLTITK
jgi:polyisoprenoid-binding protein YceI